MGSIIVLVGEDRFVIRNDAADPADVAAEIKAGLADGRFLLGRARRWPAAARS